MVRGEGVSDKINELVIMSLIAFFSGAIGVIMYITITGIIK